jgi:hypothetical protein
MSSNLHVFHGVSVHRLARRKMLESGKAIFQRLHPDSNCQSSDAASSLRTNLNIAKVKDGILNIGGGVPYSEERKVSKIDVLQRI